MNLPAFLEPIVSAIESIGYIKFLVLIAISVILYRVHPILGILAIAFTLALTFGLLA